MSNPADVPASMLADEPFITSIKPDSLVYFLLNVGDGDCQLLLLPESAGRRQAIIVDIASAPKMLSLLAELETAVLLTGPAPTSTGTFPLVVATHPHHDHIGGMPRFLRTFHAAIGEFWHPGYYIPTANFVNTMRELAPDAGGARPIVGMPTSGTVRFYGNVSITVLAPAVGLRNRFDTYGIEVNDSSISLMIEYPANRVAADYRAPVPDRRILPRRSSTRLLLGADAQHVSWAHVTVDFPSLHTSESWIARQLKLRGGTDHLRADVLKVSHHGSKHGTSLELVSRISPKFSLLSCVREGGSYGFPHQVAIEQIREALQAVAVTGAERKPDHGLGIHYTGASDGSRLLGSIAIVVPPAGRMRLWRFGDDVTEPVSFASARRWKD
ncbi:MAG: ComEC/Rec2 family competence protein [Haloechinothrix sp.]